MSAPYCSKYLPSDVSGVNETAVSKIVPDRALISRPVLPPSFNFSFYPPFNLFFDFSFVFTIVRKH